MKGNKLTVLGITDNLSGSREIRINKPLKALAERGLINAKFVDIRDLAEIKTDIFEDVDIVYNTWLLPFSTVTMSLWAEKFQFSYINDFDDTSNNETHLDYYREWVNHVVFSDFTTCTNPLIGWEISRYNDKISVLPNYVPIGENGFVGKPENKKFNGKLRCGIIGSESHIDNFLTLKGVLNRLAKNQTIVDNCEFVIAGYENSTKWSWVVNMFKKKKNLKLEMYKGKSTSEYMDLYDELDVILAPLQETHFNVARSGLKVIEASVKGCVVLGSPYYGEKEFPNTLIATTPLEYEATLLKLLQPGEFERMSKELCSKNIELNNWEGRLEETMKVFELVHNSRNVKLPENVEIHSIKYKDEQIVEYTPYFNKATEKLWRFEYNPMINIIPNTTKEYVGVFSHKFPHKTGLYKKALIKSLDELKYNEFDVINYSPKYWNSIGEYLDFSYKQHPGLEDLLQKTLSHLGVEYTKELNVTPIYANQFIMKSEYYKDYINNWIRPSLEYMENTSFWYEVNKDAQYKGGLTPEQLKEATNLDFFNFVTFILERLILFYIHNKNLKVCN